MKFATKLLICISALSLISLSVCFSRNDRSGAVYTEQTRALRVAVGYKELMTAPDNDYNQKVLEKNYPVTIVIKEKQIYGFQIQSTLLREGTFRSGVPIFSEKGDVNQVDLNENMVLQEQDEKSQYIPFVQISAGCSLTPAVVPQKIDCSVRNKNGSTNISLQLDEGAISDLDLFILVSYINTARAKRLSEINKYVVDVLDAISKFKAKKEEMSQTFQQIRDATELRRQKQIIIDGLNNRMKLADSKLSAEVTRYATLTKKVEEISKQITELNIKVRQVTSNLISLKDLRNKLNGVLTPQNFVLKLEQDLVLYEKTLSYWINGGVFHRIIDESEAVPLINMIKSGKIPEFTSKLDQYFFPQ